MSKEFDFETDVTPYHMIPISDIGNAVAGVPENFTQYDSNEENKFTPIETEKQSAREVANNVINDYTGPLTLATAATKFVTDPKVRQAGRILNAAYDAHKPIMTAYRAMPLALASIGDRMLVNTADGMNYPFLATMGMLGANTLYDYATDAVSPWADVTKETALNLGIMDAAGRMLASKSLPLKALYGGATAGGGYIWDKYFKEDEE